MPLGQGRKTALDRRLTAEEREVLLLTQRLRSPTITQQLRQRARMILLLAQGQTITAIAQEMHFARKIIYKWIYRWQAEGLRGLQDRPPGYPPGRYTLPKRHA